MIVAYQNLKSTIECRRMDECLKFAERWMNVFKLIVLHVVKL